MVVAAEGAEEGACALFEKIEVLLGTLPSEALLHGCRRGEEFVFLPGCGHELQADGQALVVHAAGHGHSRQAGQVDGDRKDVRKVHFQRVVGALAEQKGGLRGGRAEDDVRLLEGVFEIAPDERPDLAGASVVSLVIARRKGENSKKDAAAHLRAEAGGA